MDAARPLPLRIYRAADPADPDPYTLAARELLRPTPARPGSRDLEPFSRAWFEELEYGRYAGRGAWLRRALEFSRHPGEAVLVLGPGLGSDALQYHRHGARVTVCVAPTDPPELARRNFESRGYPLRVVPAAGEGLPFPGGGFDLCTLNAFDAPPADLPALVAEVYRVLKPGGKVFALLPARHWQDMVRRRRPAEESPRYSGREARAVFGGFADHQVGKRHVRRSELPYLCRVWPLGVAERVFGRVLVVRAFKPVTAALLTARAA